MADKGWQKSTFEVQTTKSGRWLIEMTSAHKTEALKCVDDLLAQNPGEGVRIVEQRDNWLTEKVIFEQKSDKNAKALKPVFVTDLQMCTTFSDYYALPSRLTIGRLLRGYLDQHGLMALELLSNIGHLRALDRMDKYFPPAMQHIAQLQSQKSDQSKTDRLDRLYLVFEKVQKRARRAEDDYEKYAQMLEQHGADRALSEIRATHPKTFEIVVSGMLALYLRGLTWAQKLALSIDIAEHSRGPATLRLADELIAEILNGGEAIDELFRGFSTCGDAWKVFVLLTSGRLSKPPKYMAPEIKRLNDLFLAFDLKETRDVLLKRISSGLSSTQKLSKNGRDADRNTFISLVRDLAEPTGLTGGADMAEAVVKRAKTLLGAEGGDLPIETAIRQALYLMPSQAGRLGLLLDFAASNLGQKHDNLVRQQLLHLLDELKSIFDLFPSDVAQKDHILQIEHLRKRLTLSTLGEQFQSTVGQSFDKLLTGETASPTPTATPEQEDANPVSQQAPAKLVKSGTDEACIKAGGVLFNEGDVGEEAYLVIHGSIEIYRTLGDKKNHLAVVGAGEIIGEMALVDNQPRVASALALEDTILVCISQDNLQERIAKLAKRDTVMHLLLKTLVRRLRGLARNTE